MNDKLKIALKHFNTDLETLEDGLKHILDYGIEDIGMIESENKLLSEFLTKLGYSSEELHEIANTGTLTVQTEKEEEIEALIENSIDDFEYNRENEVFGEDAKNNTRGDLDIFSTSLQRICNRKNIYYEIYQYNQWFENSSRVHFGTFVNKTIPEIAEIAMNGFEDLYKDFKKDVYQNGKNQWICDKYSFGFMIEELEINNNFGEK